jgi:hypothetical protein
MILSILSLLILEVAFAGKADVIEVNVEYTGKNIFEFQVTVRHEDDGWKHYANKWEVVAPDGRILGTRILLHPHVDEQPFTRSLGNVKISEGIGAVTIRAHDSVHAYGGEVITIKIPH